MKKTKGTAQPQAAVPNSNTNNVALASANQIKQVISNVNKKNYKSSITELQQFSEKYGVDAAQVILKCLFSNIDFKDKTQKDQYRCQLLSNEIQKLLNSNVSSYSTLLCQAFEGESIISYPEFLSHFSKHLKLSWQQDILVALALVHSENLKDEANRFLKSRCMDATLSLLNGLPETILQTLLYYLNTNNFKPQLQHIEKNLPQGKSTFESLSLETTSQDNDAPQTKEIVDTVHLSNVMKDKGYSCCESSQSIRNLLSQFPSITEADIAKVIGMMARTHTDLEGAFHDQSESSLKTWNIHLFIDTVKEYLPNLNWKDVIKNLDHPGFVVNDAKGLALITACYRRATSLKEAFPIEYLFHNWNNTSGQLSFLKLAVQAPPDSFNFLSTSSKVDAEGLQPTSKTSFSYTWQSLALIDTLLMLSEVENYGTCRAIFNYPLKNCPDLLLLGIAQSKSSRTALANELASILLPPLLQQTPPTSTSGFVINKVWTSNPPLLVKGFVELFKTKPASLVRIVEITTQEIKALPQVLDSRHFNFTIELACAAFSRMQQFPALEKWLQEKANEYGEPFLKLLLQSFKEKLTLLKERPQMPQDLFSALANVLMLHLPKVSPEIAEQIRNLAPKFQKPLSPPQPQVTSQAPSSQEQVANDRVFSKEVEEAANGYFQKIYTEKISISEAVSLLQNFKNSSDSVEQDIFTCMIHNLFDEYKFFPQYPDKELQITGILFGSLIQHDLIANIHLQIALKYILDAVKKPPGTRMFNFGVTALQHFKFRLPLWPQYCSHLLAIDHLKKYCPDVLEIIIVHFVQKNSDADPKLDNNNNNTNITLTEPSQPFNPSVPPAKAPSETTQPAPKPNSEGLPPPEEKAVPFSLSAYLAQTDPPPTLSEQVLDKIHFIINNLSENNLPQKISEFKAIVTGQTEFSYVIHYMVIKRITLEPNFHGLYMKFFTGLELPALFQMLYHKCLTAARVLLASDTVLKEVGDKNQLKNLGTWIGLSTLAKNKPILHRDISLKDLIFDGYKSGRLIAVIPFVCRVMETCKDSTIFKLPNPWVSAILRLLAEVNNKENLRLGLRFEIEVLCKALTIELNDLKPTDLLKFHKQYIGPNNFDFNPPPTPVIDRDDGFQQLANFLVIQNHLALFVQKPHLTRFIPIAIDRAIKDIINPVVERSVNIASITTREIAIKDFATEPDENKMRNAAQLMVQNLAGSLAMVTCKEPLRIAIANNLRSIFTTQVGESPHIDIAVQTITTDNLDLASSLIEKAATERAIKETNDQLNQAFMQRKNHREARTNKVFFDTNTKFPSALPDFLRPNIGGLLPAQLHVYEDFGPINNTIPKESASFTSSDEKESSKGPYPPSATLSPSVSQEATTSSGLTLQQAAERFGTIYQKLEGYMNQLLQHQYSFSQLPADHEIWKLIKQIPIIISQCTERNAPAQFTHNIFRRMFRDVPPVYLEVQLAMLEVVIDLDKKLTKEIVNWITNTDDEIKFNIPVTVGLIRNGLISIPDYDLFLAKQLQTESKKASDFCSFLVRHCIIEHSYLTPGDLRTTLETYEKYANFLRAEDMMKVLEDVRGVITRQRNASSASTNSGEPAPAQEIMDQDLSSYRQQVTLLLQEWNGVMKEGHPPNNFVMKLQKLCYEKMVSIPILLRLGFEICYTTFSPNNADYTLIDNFCQLVVTLVKFSEAESKITLVSSGLAILVRILMREHNSGPSTFQQKPFHRLFSNLLVDLCTNETEGNVSTPILLSFSSVFHLLLPSRFPGFTFAWLELISHRVFMPKLLLAKSSKGWVMFQGLLVELFRFLEPHLRKTELPEPIRLMYTGTLRILLVLLHDFPEFLCDYHFSFCDAIPPAAIQMRNLILSAYPRHMRLPDPFTPSLKVDVLPEIHQTPQVSSNFISILANTNLKTPIDHFLKTRQPMSFFLELQQKLTLNSEGEGTPAAPKYNVSLINALVLYVGSQAISTAKAANVAPISLQPHMDIFQCLLSDLSSEGRYLFLNAIANQLRYPNSHTHYFSCVILSLFAEAGSEAVKEQITRVLLERLVVSRPHPWGLLITFIELIKNPRFHFLNHSFTHCAPEIERLFSNVAKFCMPNPQQQQQPQPQQQ